MDPKEDIRSHDELKTAIDGGISDLDAGRYIEGTCEELLELPLKRR